MMDVRQSVGCLRQNTGPRKVADQKIPHETIRSRLKLVLPDQLKRKWSGSAETCEPLIAIVELWSAAQSIVRGYLEAPR
jgi:hypothetical protein